MAKRRTAGIQRRTRASDEALERRMGDGGGLPVDWRILLLAGLLVVGAVVGVMAITLGSGPDRYFGQVVADDGGGHVADGTRATGYSSTPGTSGLHWNTPAQWGVYGPQLSGARSQAIESQTIHNLEHGGIVIWYQPDRATADDVERVANWVRGQLRTERFKVLVSPWDGDDFGHAWAVTAWRHLLYLDEDPLDGIRRFTDHHYGRRGPEPRGGPGPPSDQ
jgi:hypothetical protein